MGTGHSRIPSLLCSSYYLHVRSSMSSGQSSSQCHSVAGSLFCTHGCPMCYAWPQQPSSFKPSLTAFPSFFVLLCLRLRLRSMSPRSRCMPRTIPLRISNQPRSGDDLAWPACFPARTRFLPRRAGLFFQHGMACSVALHTSWLDYVLLNPALLAETQEAVEVRQLRHPIESWEEAHAFLAPCQVPFMELIPPSVNASNDGLTTRVTLYAHSIAQLGNALRPSGCAGPAPSQHLRLAWRSSARHCCSELNLRLSFTYTCTRRKHPSGAQGPSKDEKQWRNKLAKGRAKAGSTTLLAFLLLPAHPSVRGGKVPRTHGTFALEFCRGLTESSPQKSLLCDFFLNDRLVWIFCL